MKKGSDRREYTLDKLEIIDCPENPLELFNSWFDLAKKKIVDYNAFILATCSKNSIPSSRVVLLKQHDEKGYVFFTNYHSKKGKEIEVNPNVSFLFSWLPLEKQIRITGKIVKTSEEESDEYFYSRPIESQIAASLSKQSEIVQNRYRFISDFTLSVKDKKKKEIKRPSHWGGYRLVPSYYEFWQGRESRLHDRVIYQKQKINWKKEILYP